MPEIKINEMSLIYCYGHTLIIKCRVAIIRVGKGVRKMSDKDIKTLITSGTIILAVVLYLIFS